MKKHKTISLDEDRSWQMSLCSKRFGVCVCVCWVILKHDDEAGILPESGTGFTHADKGKKKKRDLFCTSKIQKHLFNGCARLLCIFLHTGFHSSVPSVWERHRGRRVQVPDATESSFPVQPYVAHSLEKVVAQQHFLQNSEGISWENTHVHAHTNTHTLPTHLLLVQLNCVSPFAVVHLALRFQTEREKNHLSVCIFAFWFIFFKWMSFDASWNATTDLPCSISSLTTSTTCCCPKVSWRKQEITAPIRFKLWLNGPECQRRCCVFHNQQPLTAMKRSGTL